MSRRLSAGFSGEAAGNSICATPNIFSVLRGMNNNGEDMDSEIERKAELLASQKSAALPKATVSRHSIVLLSTHKPTYANLSPRKLVGPTEVGCFGSSKLGCFSYKKCGSLKFDRSQVKTLSPDLDPTKVAVSGGVSHLLIALGQPQASSCNLARDYKPIVAVQQRNTIYATPLLHWISHNHGELLLQDRFSTLNVGNQATASVGKAVPSLADCCGGAEFVGMVRLLVTVASTLCYPRQAWEVNVVRFQDVFFLVSVTTEPFFLVGKETADDDLNRHCGRKFERLATKSSDASGARFHSVVRASIEAAKSAHGLLVGGRIDCENEKQEYVELSARRAVEVEKDLQSVSLKMMEYWLQCHLMAVPNVVVGFHSQGALRGIAEMSTEDLPKLAASIRPGSWQPSTCLNFLDAFLGALKETITKNDVAKVYQVKYAPDQQLGITIRRRKKSETADDKFFEFFRESFAKEFV